MAKVPGVAAHSGDVSALGVVPFDRIDGKPVTTSGAPQLGVGVLRGVDGHTGGYYL